MNNNRKLSAAEYFLAIQKEYLIAKFRSKIYYSPKDKKYWKRVMRYKFEKIESIARRNSLNSILNNKEKLREFEEELFDENGKPKFELTEDDLRNYYVVGNEFSYQGEIYVLVSNLDDVRVKIRSKRNDDSIIVDKDSICRII